jgi:tetratricopeptide (TPR) repeat protein
MSVAQASPFKLLDAYTADDRAIFFGRDAEIEQLYKLIHQSDLLLVYGRSGTGKTSLVQCGLAGRFKPTDRFEILVRRQENLNAALMRELQRAAASDGGTPLTDSISLPDAVYSIYMDRLRPIHLLFDQFEELLLLGTAEEQQQFFASIVTLLQRKLRCKVILVMREEFLAMLDPFEATLPGLYASRCRIERMTSTHLEDVIVRTAKAIPVVLAEGQTTAGQILENLGTGVQLSYLQVYLDKLYRRATEVGQGGTPPSPVVFTADLVRETGALEDVLASFLAEQVKAVQAGLTATPGMPPDAAQRILEEFATIEGTKQPMTPAELKERLSALGPVIDGCLLAFVARRVLRPVDDFYELAHDSLARRIADTRGAERKMQLKAQRLIQDHLADDDPAHPRLLSDDDLDFIKPFEANLELTAEERAFLRTSVAARRRKQRARMRRQLALAAAIVVALSAALIWALVKQAQIERILTDARAAAGDLVRIEGSLQNVPGAQTVRQELRTRTRWLVERLEMSDVGSQEDPNVWFWTLLRNGDQHVYSWDGHQARTYYQEARDLAAEGAESTGETVWQRNLAVAEMALGDLFLDTDLQYRWDDKTDRLALAAEAYAAAAEIFQRLAQQDPRDQQAEADVFAVTVGLGKLAMQQGDVDAAQSRFAEALRVAGHITDDKADIVAALGTSTATAMRKVQVHSLIGDALEGADVAAARQSYTEAIEIAEQVFQEIDRDTAVASQLFALHTQAGWLDATAGDFEAARARYARAQELNMILADDSDRNEGAIYAGLANISFEQEDWPTARRHHQAQHQVLERRLRTWPDSIDARRALYGCYVNLGAIEVNLSNVAGARAMYLKAQAVARELDALGQGRVALDEVTERLAGLGR